MDTTKTCPSCGKALAANAPAGLCPECLMQAAFPTGTEPQASGTKTYKFQPPSIEALKPYFPQLEILSFIGQGGMGAVYKARQPMLDRYVALKILPPEAASGPGFTERFTREARALARLNHPNIVAVHEFGATSGEVGRVAPRAPQTPAHPQDQRAGERRILGYHYLIMEFVDGANLREMERAQRLSPAQALSIVPKICEALQYAHDEGVVHRDIKPENILVDKKGRVKIADFGIAKILGAEQPQAPLTGVVGTPHYMAPEQVEKPQTVDHRADIYSLGVVFYEMLTGELPLGRFAAPSKKVQIDVRLDEVVLRALEKEPELRYQKAGQVKAAVETISNTTLLQESSEPAKASNFNEATLRYWFAIRVIRCLAAVVVISGLIYAFVLVPFHPDNADGNTVVVFTLARSYRAGDKVIYRLFATGYPTKYLLGRVVESSEDGTVAIQRHKDAPLKIALEDVVGKVIFNTRSDSHQPPIVAHFGPARERTINAVSAQTNCMLNLLTGEFLTPPDYIVKDLDPRRSYDPKTYRQSYREVQNWCRDNDAHLAGPIGNNFLLNSLPTIWGSGPQPWDASVEQVTNILEENMLPVGGVYNNSNVAEIVLARQATNGHTVAFKTSHGKCGLLRVIRTNNVPPLSITIEYKLVED